MEAQTATREQQWPEPSSSSAVAVVNKQHTVGLVNPEETKGWADIFRKSGLFSFEGSPEVQLAQAQVKILAGAEMGLQPFFAMQQLYIVKGHIFVSAMAYGALINQPDPDGICRRKYKIIEATADKAIIEFYRIDPVAKAWELAHTQTYTWDEVPPARRNNPTYQTDRPDMIWNRCMTKGGRKFAPEKVGGIRTLEDAADESDFREVGGNGHDLLPEDVKRTEPTTVAAQPAEQAAEVAAPVAVEKSKRKTKATAEPVVDPGPSDEEILDSGPDEGVARLNEDEPDNAAEGFIEPDDAALVVTTEQAAEINDWIMGEHFTGAAAAITQSGLPKPERNDIRMLTRAHYAAIKQARDAWIRECAEAYGWKLDPGLQTNEKQREELKHNWEKGLRRA